MAGFFRWLRQWRNQEPGGLREPRHRPRPRWQVLESVASPAIGSLHRQVLQQAGIPVLTQEWGAGSAAMGGASTGVRLLVPEDRLAEAREVLDLGMVGSEEDHE